MSKALKAAKLRVHSEATELKRKRATSAKRRLTDTYVEGLNSRAREYAIADADVAGLVIRVLPSGRKSWAWRGSFGGSAVRRTLGTFPILSCADARLAVVSLKLDYQPSSPKTKLGLHQPIGPTFETLATCPCPLKLGHILA